jgi:hypothetical protein
VTDSNSLGAPLPPPLPGVSQFLRAELELAELINRLGMQVLLRATPGNEPNEGNNQCLVAATLYARALMSYQSALVLIGRGSVADARTIVRSAAETTIVLNAVVLDVGVCDSLMDRHNVNQRKLLNAWASDPQANAIMSEEQRSKFDSALKELSGAARTDPINIASLAVRTNLTWMYNIVYRMSSSDAAHTTLDALSLHVRANEDGDIVGLSFGPRTEKLADTVIQAMNCLLISMHAVSSLFSMSDLQPEMDERLEALKRLQDER